MNDLSADDDSDLWAHIAALERKLSIRNGYIRQISTTGSDWEFTIKLAVLCEAMATRALLTKLNAGPIIQFVSTLGQQKRIDLCVQLSLLTRQDARPLEWLNRVRNEFAHVLENLEHTLEQFAREIPAKDIKDFLREVLNAKDGALKAMTADLSWFPSAFKAMLFTRAAHSLTLLFLVDETSQAKARVDEWHRATGEEAANAHAERVASYTPNALQAMFAKPHESPEDSA